MNEMNKRSLQKVTEMGLDEALGMGSDMLDDISYEYQFQTITLPRRRIT